MARCASREPAWMPSNSRPSPIRSVSGGQSKRQKASSSIWAEAARGRILTSNTGGSDMRRFRSHLLLTALGIGTLYCSAALPADAPSPLRGHLVGTDGKPLAGIPVKAHLANTNITVAVYTDSKGDYDFPSWSDVKPGTWSVGVELPDFDHVRKDAVAIASGKTARVDFTLKPVPLTYENATASEIIAGLPGTDQQK